ncbi:MAG: hypothetical protein A2161_20350 [Candidatus Schekmanbacteria bacterium RBG_13_48_7]|uniref:Uncharacterized protein n=1 Tax=Candidatus Schekmanbacteria bacterium RBG_13_48_7 TaxID=1817878 RepID=A0A1F7RIL0_9BACT|nr:MAG: hypothetical protein A2161_20350 [Candidatus Schekmanbacteria bacterium RBG_13_48_7]
MVFSETYKDDDCTILLGRRVDPPLAEKELNLKPVSDHIDKNFVILLGSRVVPPLAEKELNLKPVGNKIDYLPPGVSTDFKKAVRLTDGSLVSYSPDVTGDEYGAHVVWVSNESVIPETSEIYYRYAGVDTSTGIIQISETDRYIDCDPVIARCKSGEVYIFWSAYDPLTGYDIYYTHGTYTDGFATEEAIVSTINDDTHPAVASDPEGLIYLVYETGDSTNRDLMGLYFDPGVSAPIPVEIHPSNTSNDRNPSIDIDPVTETPVFAWENDEGGTVCVMAREFCTPGTVCRISTPGACTDLFPSIAASVLEGFPTVSWFRYDGIEHESKIYLKGPHFSDDEEIE